MSLLQEVCQDVCSEPHLQQLSGEVLNGRTCKVFGLKEDIFLSDTMIHTRMA